MRSLLLFGLVVWSACGPKVNAVLRWDVFNVLNRTNFGLPNRNLTDTANVGTITSLGGDPRLMQVSLRLTF